MGKTVALPRRAACLQTSGWVRQVHRNWHRDLSTVPWEPFGLNVEISGMLFRGSSSSIGASRELGRRKSQGTVHSCGSCWGKGPSQPFPTTAEPDSCPPGSRPSPLLLPPSSLSAWACIATTGSGIRSGNKTLEKPGAEPRGVSAPRPLAPRLTGGPLPPRA